MKKKNIRYLFFGFFLIGILLANLLGKQCLEGSGIFNTYFLQQFEYARIDETELFLYILRVRLPVFGVLGLVGITQYWRGAHVLLISWSGMAVGFLLVSALSNLGPKGIFFVIVSMLPQYIFYIAAYFLLLEVQTAFHECGKMQKRGAWLLAGGLAVLMILSGILTETYVNPRLMKSVLKIF